MPYPTEGHGSTYGMFRQATENVSLLSKHCIQMFAENKFALIKV
jgi:hypothetical protein